MATNGMQRLINNVCEAAIDIVADENKTIITKEIMQRGIEEILRKQEIIKIEGYRWIVIKSTQSKRKMFI